MKPKKFILFFYGPVSKSWIVFRTTKKESEIENIVANHLHPSLTCFPPYKLQIRKVY